MAESTAESEEIYVETVQKLSDEIDSNTKKTIEIITHCDELDKDLSHLTELSRQIKSVDKALDQLLQEI
ncbi:hypothetical protein BDB01DRAFT_775567 [Pilobolus umbonatus]|nr:hypothetical protein BDB01DRAFT_775567 [Pilobolus umbonatus]